MQHNGRVRQLQDRDEQTVLIGTALGLFAVVMAAQALGLWLLSVALDIDVERTLFGWAVVIAGTSAIAYLVRAMRR